MTNSLPPQRHNNGPNKTFNPSALGLFQQPQQRVGNTSLTVPSLGLSYREVPAKGITGDTIKNCSTHAALNNSFLLDYRLGADIKNSQTPCMVRVGLTPGSGSTDELQVQAFSYDNIINAVTQHEEQFAESLKRMAEYALMAWLLIMLNTASAPCCTATGIFLFSTTATPCSSNGLFSTCYLRAKRPVPVLLPGTLLIQEFSEAQANGISSQRLLL